MKTLLFVSLSLTLSVAAWANRCEWNPLVNEARCCNAKEQAIYDGTLNEMRCVSSESGDSCAWSPALNEIRCCHTDQHAVWDRAVNELRCFSF